MAVKFLKAFGAHVTVISTSPSKKDEATKVLGADQFLVSKDKEQMEVSCHSYSCDALRSIPVTRYE